MEVVGTGLQDCRWRVVRQSDSRSRTRGLETRVCCGVLESGCAGAGEERRGEDGSWEVFVPVSSLVMNFTNKLQAAAPRCCDQQKQIWGNGGGEQETTGTAHLARATPRPRTDADTRVL